MIKKNDEKDEAQAGAEDGEKAAPPECLPPAAEETASCPPPETAEDAETSASEKDGEKSQARKHRRHDPDVVRTMKEKIERLEEELDGAGRENSDLKDKYLRLAAEMENARKRLERERLEFHQFALADVLKDILGVLDNFERARRTGEGPEGLGFQEGLDLIHKQFTDLLRKRGLTPVETSGRKFDPTVHQAILTEEHEGLAEAEVGEELQRGYYLHGRLLRPALVKVFMPKKD